MHSWTSFWRLSWKEYRVQQSLWLSVFGLSLGTLLLIPAMIGLWQGWSAVNRDSLVVVAWVWTAIYMLGSGATLFALEHELGTYDFLRLLPVKRRLILLAKVGVGVVTGAALLAALLAVVYAVFDSTATRLGANEWLAAAANIGEIFLWAILFSFLLRNPLRAAVCAPTAMAISVCIILPYLTPTPWTEDFLHLYQAFLGYRVTVILLLLAIDTALATGWAAGHAGWPQAWRWSPRPATPRGWQVPAAGVPVYVPARYPGWWRHAVLSWRQGLWILLPALAALVWAGTKELSYWSNARNLQGSVGIPVAVLAVLAWGIGAFGCDQWSYHYRFFAERGVSPRQVWLARQAFWGLPVLLLGGGLQWLLSAAAPATEPLNPNTFFSREGGLLWLLVTLYAIGQACGLLIHSSLVASVVALFLSVAAGYWMALSHVGGIPASWGLWSIPLVLFYVTWRHSPDWIEDRWGKRQWLRLAADLGVPALLVSAGSAWHRAYELPRVDPGFSLAEFSRELSAEQRATLQLYQAAAAEMHARGWLNGDAPHLLLDTDRMGEASRTVLPLLEKAHTSAPVPLPAAPFGPLSPQLAESPEVRLERAVPLFLGLLRAESVRQLREGNPSGSWQTIEQELELLARLRLRPNDVTLSMATRHESTLLEALPEWAAHPQQSSAQVRRALDQLVAFDLHHGSTDGITKQQLVSALDWLDGRKPDLPGINLSPNEAFVLSWLRRVAPWEVERSRRLCLLNARLQLGPPLTAEEVGATNRERFLSLSIHNTFKPIGNFAPPGSFQILPLTRRATWLQMALADWKRVHGQLPESLDQLQGEYFSVLPTDPGTGGSFQFSSTGVDDELSVAMGTGPIPPRTPILWVWRFGTLGQMPEDRNNPQLIFSRSGGWIWPIR